MVLTKVAAESDLRVARFGQALAVWSVAAIVAVVPLLLDLSNLADTYYGPKARALTFFAPVLIVALTACLADPTVRRQLPWRSLAAFALVTAAATLRSVNPAWSLYGTPWRHEGMLTLLTYALICATTGAAAIVSPVIWLVAVLSGATIVAVYGIVQYLGHEWLVLDALRVGWWQAFSTTGNPNWLGAYMALVVPLAMAAVLISRTRTALILSTLSLALLYLAGLFTYSRAAWAGLAIGIAACTVVWRLGKFPARRFAGIALLVLTLTATFLLPGGPFAPRAGGPTPAQRAGTVLTIVDGEGGTLESRLYLWRTTYPLLMRRALLGYGPETFPLVYPQEWDEERQRVFGSDPVVIDKAHNETLDMAMSIGLAGVVAFWWLLGTAMLRAWRAAATSGPQRMLGAACLAGVLAYWIDLQFHFSIISVAPIFWSMLGFAVTLPTERPRETSS